MSAESARIWRAANPGYQRAWRVAHREEQRAYMAVYRAEHRDEIRAQARFAQAARYRADPDPTRERAAAYQLAHREQANAYGRAWRDKVAGSEWLRNRTAARNAVTHALERGEIQREPCYGCGAEPAQAHHGRGYAPEFWLDVLWLCAAHHGRAHRTVAA